MNSPRRRLRAVKALVIAGVVGCSLTVAACGPAFPVPRIPKFPSIPSVPSTPSFNASGDTADFFFDPEHVTITQSGRVQVDFGVPALRYRGPLGCRGRTFTGDVTDNINFVFRYGSRDAWLGWDNGNTWHFTHRPRIGHGTVTFAQHFSDGRTMVIVVHCPPPPRTGRL
jgi:hypothetical protein